MYKIMIVEDDGVIANTVAHHMESWGCETHCVENFQKVLAEFVAFDPQLVLLDISLPFFNGYHWCNEIRKISKIPIIFLSSASDNMNIVMAMNMGGDDFIAKPFDYDVLIAKMQALLRRAYDFAGHMPVLECRGAFLHLEKNTLTYGDAVITLTKNEHRILSLLMENKDSIVSRERLMDALWESDCYVDDNTLSVNVNRLRKKLEANGLSDFIGTKFGVGYYIQKEKDDEKE